MAFTNLKTYLDQQKFELHCQCLHDLKGTRKCKLTIICTYCILSNCSLIIRCKFFSMYKADIHRLTISEFPNLVQEVCHQHPVNNYSSNKCNQTKQEGYIFADWTEVMLTNINKLNWSF